jgi:phosphate uptake regulator
MEIRKVQITGGSSYVITLPKEWAKMHNLKKNEPIGLITQPNGTLLLTPKITGDKLVRAKELDLKYIKEPTQLMRMLIGAYIDGYNTIKLYAKNSVPPMVRPIVREFASLTIGQEVVEETPTSITLKDLLNPAEMPIDKTIRRMHIIVRSMHEDSMTALMKGRPNLAQEVRSRDNEVDRLHWLVSRQYNLIIKNVTLTEKLGVTIEEATIYYLISRIMERIGDHAVRISKHIPTLLERKVNPKILEKIEKAGVLSLNLFNQSVEALFKGDLKGSNENIDNLEELEDLCRSINSLALRHKGAIAIAVGYIAESLRRVGEYAKNISETVINHLIGQE